ADGVVVDVVVRRQDVVGDRDLEARRATVELVADHANALGARHPQRGIQRAVGDVVLDQPVHGEGRIEPVVEVPGGFVLDDLEVVHEAGLDPVLRKVLYGEATNVDALKFVCARKKLWPATLRGRIDPRLLVPKWRRRTLP